MSDPLNDIDYTKFAHVAELNMVVPRDWVDLVRACRAEVYDPDWIGHPHGLQKVYIRGCRGPLCKWAQRTYHRRQTHARLKGIRFTESPLDKYHDFLQTYSQWAIENFADDVVDRKTRIVRTQHAVPMSTIKRFQKSRARLAS